MYEDLVFQECRIESISDELDESGKRYKKANIETEIDEELNTRKVATTVLRDDVLLLLKRILSCEEDEQIVGREIIAVTAGHYVSAIGYQGLYVKLFNDEFDDEPLEIVSESELCKLLHCTKVLRLNKSGDPIAVYFVPVRPDIDEKQLY